MQFEKGQSGNPAGRPPGIRDKRTAMRELLVPHAEALVAKAVEKALEGDTTALRICIDRLIPAAKPKDDPIELPAMTGTLADSGQAVLSAVAEGRISPEEAGALMTALASQARIVEVTEIEKRLAALEEAAKKGKRCGPMNGD